MSAELLATVPTSHISCMSGKDVAYLEFENDLLATVYRHLGIDYKEMVPDTSGRPVPLIPHGEPIRELL